MIYFRTSLKTTMGRGASGLNIYDYDYDYDYNYDYDYDYDYGYDYDYDYDYVVQFLIQYFYPKGWVQTMNLGH